jgi:hypothetical protein
MIRHSPIILLHGAATAEQVAILEGNSMEFLTGHYLVIKYLQVLTAEFLVGVSSILTGLPTPA